MMTRLFFVLLITAGASAAVGCSGDDCGPGDAPADGLSIDVTGTTLTYGDGTTSPNNDCSVADAPTSLTIDIAQVDPAPAMRRALILCVPRPDLLGDPLALTSDAEVTGVQVIDIFADADGCLISLDRSRAITGTATFTGACDGGADPAGYALALASDLPATRACSGMPDEAITITLSGELAITAL